MRSVTIHNIYEPLWAILKSKAQLEGQSLNKTIKMLLENATGVKPKVVQERKGEFSEFLGCWSKSDLNNFNKNISDFENIDAEDWE